MSRDVVRAFWGPVQENGWPRAAALLVAFSELTAGEIVRQLLCRPAAYDPLPGREG